MKTVDELLAHLKIDKWDLLLIGDGSGSNWEYGCGWGCVSIERATFKREVWAGSLNRGTVNVAEFMAYVQPLMWYTTQGEKGKFRTVHIVTDSQVVASNKGNGHICRKFLDQFLSYGLLIHTHWLERQTINLNEFADIVSKQAYANIKKDNHEKNALLLLGKDNIYDVEPKA